MGASIARRSRRSDERYEAAEIAKAKQDIADGKGITGPELERFLDWFVSGEGTTAPGRSASD